MDLDAFSKDAGDKVKVVARVEKRLDTYENRLFVCLKKENAQPEPDN